MGMRRGCDSGDTSSSTALEEKVVSNVKARDYTETTCPKIIGS